MAAAAKARSNRRQLPITGFTHKTGVVGAADEAAIGAGLDMAAERRRPTQLDGTHHPPLEAAQMTVMSAPIGIAVAAENIRHFQAGRHGAAGSSGWHHLQRQPVERALGPLDEPG